MLTGAVAASGDTSAVLLSPPGVTGDSEGIAQVIKLPTPHPGRSQCLIWDSARQPP